jgi:hypothetical protein
MAILLLVFVCIYDTCILSSYLYTNKNNEDDEYEDKNNCTQFFLELMRGNQIDPENEEEVTWIESEKENE